MAETDDVTRVGQIETPAEWSQATVAAVQRTVVASSAAASARCVGASIGAFGPSACISSALTVTASLSDPAGG